MTASTKQSERSSKCACATPRPAIPELRSRDLPARQRRKQHLERVLAREQVVANRKQALDFAQIVQPHQLQRVLHQSVHLQQQQRTAQPTCNNLTQCKNCLRLRYKSSCAGTSTTYSVMRSDSTLGNTNRCKPILARMSSTFLSFSLLNHNSRNVAFFVPCNSSRRVHQGDHRVRIDQDALAFRHVLLHF